MYLFRKHCMIDKLIDTIQNFINIYFGRRIWQYFQIYMQSWIIITTQYMSKSILRWGMCYNNSIGFRWKNLITYLVQRKIYIPYFEYKISSDNIFQQKAVKVLWNMKLNEIIWNKSHKQKLLNIYLSSGSGIIFTKFLNGLKAIV